ncbi:MAG: hypothetical protein AB7E67_08455 [Xanthobacteraceae bacterium]
MFDRLWKISGTFFGLSLEIVEDGAAHNNACLIGRLRDKTALLHFCGFMDTLPQSGDPEWRPGGRKVLVR